MWCNGRSPTCPDDSPPRTENTCSRDAFRHRSQQQTQYLESVIMRSLTCYRCLMSPLAAGTVRSFGSLYCGRTLAFNWPSHSTSFSIMTPNAAIFDNGHQILMTVKMTAEMSKIVPGGHEGRHVQLQRKGHVGGDLPPELRWMLKPLDGRKHRNERCRRAAEFFRSTFEERERRPGSAHGSPTDLLIQPADGFHKDWDFFLFCLKSLNNIQHLIGSWAECKVAKYEWTNINILSERG